MFELSGLKLAEYLYRSTPSANSHSNSGSKENKNNMNWSENIG